MPRPVKCRHVQCRPDALYFKPRAVPLSELEELVLTYDELEALRLADLEGLYQEDGAARMRISRQTFGNIVKAARKKVADALVGGKAIRIEGGVCRIDRIKNDPVCEHCSHRLQDNPGLGLPWICPTCNKRQATGRKQEHKENT